MMFFNKSPIPIITFKKKSLDKLSGMYYIPANTDLTIKINTSSEN